MVKLNLTYEEVRAYKKNIFEVEVVNGFKCKMSLTDTQIVDLKEEYETKLDNRSPTWRNDLDAHVFQKMQTKLPKNEKFDRNWLSEMPQVIDLISLKIIHLTNLDKYKPVQKTISEVVIEKRVEVKVKK